jgi:hypothetical protein
MGPFPDSNRIHTLSFITKAAGIELTLLRSRRRSCSCGFKMERFPSKGAIEKRAPAVGYLLAGLVVHLAE